MMRDRLVVIGASAGGLRVLQRLVAALPEDLPAALLIVMHIGPHRSYLPDLLSNAGPLLAAHPTDGEPLLPRRIYIAPPDQHMLVEGHSIRLMRTAKEHHTRPAIDPLFRSAALAHGPAVIGVVLSGGLDDGTAGLQAIKTCGGIAVVQDPKDAEEPSMPRSALRHVAVDHCVTSSAIGALCVELVRRPGKEAPTMPSSDLQHEHSVSVQRGDPIEHLDAIGARSMFTCPDCHGALWDISQGEHPRYRCHTGHAFTLRTLIESQSEITEAALWSTLRALKEKHQMLTLLEAIPGEDMMRLRAQVGLLEKQVAGLREIVQEKAGG